MELFGQVTGGTLGAIPDLFGEGEGNAAGRALQGEPSQSALAVSVK